MAKLEQKVWFEKYRPATVDDLIVADDVKKALKAFVKDGYFPNLILYGLQGTGKTSASRALLNDIGAEYIEINGSLEGGIDMLRDKIKKFASTMSRNGQRKYVLIDEADYLSGNKTQFALRNFMETHSKNCGFILTANHIKKIIEPLHSRCALFDFTIPDSDMKEIGTKFLERFEKILTEEEIKYSKNEIVKFIKAYYPDWRRILNEMQKCSRSGKLKFQEASDTSWYVEIVEAMSKAFHTRDFLASKLSEKVYAAGNIDYSGFYETLKEELIPATIPNAVVLVGKYQYQHEFVSDIYINFLACCVEIVMNCQFKD